MELVGHDDLQGRSAYQPTIHQERGRFIAYVYIPATTERTAERCVTTDGTRSGEVAIQTNNVEGAERRLVYLADRANSGLHIVRLTGGASRIAGGN